MRTMKKRPSYSPNTFSNEQLAVLKSEKGKAHAEAPIKWKRIEGGQKSGDMNVYYEGHIALNTGILRIRINLHRPYQQFFLHLVSGVPVNRVCVHQAHKGIDSIAHLHSYLIDGREETQDLPESFPVAQIDSNIDLNTFRRATEEFAKICFINLPENWWVEPNLAEWNEVKK